MLQRHSSQDIPGSGGKVDSPTVNIKCSRLEELSTSSFHDSGHHELLKSYSFNNTLFIEKKEEDPTLIHEQLKTSILDLTNPFESPTQRKKFVFPKKENNTTPELCETPKVSGKKCLLRRRLDVSFSLLKGKFGSQNSSVESSVSQGLNLERYIPSSDFSFPRQSNFSPLVTSTIKTEEVTSSSQNLRLNFSQHKTSTIDGSKDDCGLFEAECISPIQGNDFKDSITHDFSDSSLSVNDENVHPELLSSSGGRTTFETDGNIFVTPVNHLAKNINFNASLIEARNNISTPEDSGFNSLSLDKSEDSLSDQEGSFQELLQRHKGTLKLGDTIRKSRCLGRSRRLSTLREQGSQSETEEEKQVIHSTSEARPVAASNTSEHQLSNDNKSGDLTFTFKNLSNTPALQLVQELFMKSKRKRFQQVDDCGFLEERNEGKIAVLQCVLAGLIGKKMGIEQLDILTELKYRNLKHVLSMVLDSLTPESLYSVWRVSRNWREIVAQDKKANRRRKIYITQLKANSEEAVLSVEDAATRLHLLNRSALRSVQAQAQTPSTQKEQVPTLSPWGEILTPIASSSVTPLNSKQEEYFKEDCLATDDFLVDYFNEFLSLPTFSEAIRFNMDYGVFEIINEAPQLLEKQLKKILLNQQPRNPIYDVIRKGKNEVKPLQMHVHREEETINVNYNIMCLNREQGIKWIKKERLPAFLESDCYFEYRLAKLVSQVRWSKSGMNFTIGANFAPWLLRKIPSPQPSLTDEDDLIIMKKFYISLGEASYTQTKDWFSLAKQCQQTVSTFALPCSMSHSKVTPSVSESFIFDDGVHPRTKNRPSNLISLEEEEEGSVCVKDTASQALLRIYLEKQQSEIEEHLELHFSTCEEFLNSFVVFVLNSAIQKITGLVLENPDFIDFTHVTQVSFDDCFESALCQKLVGRGVPTTDENLEDKLGKISLSSASESIGPESRADWCVSHRTYDIGNRKEFERFKKFIKGTLGERYWWLWMDIERLKVLKEPGRHQRHLEKMKKCYLVSSGECYLSPEILSKLKLLDGAQWTDDHLKNIQVEVVKPLLLYWAPRFCVTHSTSTKHASAELKFWRLRQEKPRMDIDPFPQMATLLPLRPKSCIPQIPDVQKEEVSLTQPPKSPRKPDRVKTAIHKSWKGESLNPPAKDDGIEKGSRYISERSKVIHLTSFTDISECLKPQLERRYIYTEKPNVKNISDVGALGGYDMENLLQSLYVENRAGFFFTKFCEDSGNKLWKNSVYFWFDLQAYHQLFYQETLQPFKVCKQAQYLFATYVAPSATFDIGLEQEKKKEIYMKIQPPFEDLFDTAEEYILLILLEPWSKMVKSDQVTYRKVELEQETRQLDSTYFRKLQALHKETFSKKAEGTTDEIGTSILSLANVSKQTEYWNNVPEEYKHFTFNDLLNNKLEFEHFRQFLESHSSSMDLMCWIDIEQFRRIVFKDRNQREAKSIYIKNKYLNKRYFFGPKSPASIYQQNEIMRLSGGWGKILHEQLDAPVLVEVQKHVLNRLENVWLPLFLANEQFAARQKIKPVESKWISSSCEIIAFRKALLNPITSRQFQRFVALKGDLLENGVLFWQEVQKYKDLCHSHCSESVIQQKITTIINCFINSCIPPALQIDIPIEQAQKIIEHRKELGPYIFREAQMTIFGVLFKYWPQFCEFSKNLTDEKIMSVLERRQEYKQKKKTSLFDEEKFGKIGAKPSTIASAPKTVLPSESSLGLQAYGRQPTWCYSKYIEALEQERILLKIQEELERKMFTGTTSLTNFLKSTGSPMNLKKNVSLHSFQSEFPSNHMLL
ncbi:regulator of G-protein signaling 22-like isoform X3 [Dipodomys merriami]|uniref:regulator of G-protein signaling 22-like isoform X3 n=1 Tax=Dipodomys merriami TaxID=94247 RepID=UPI003855F0A8